MELTCHDMGGTLTTSCISHALLLSLVALADIKLLEVLSVMLRDFILSLFIFWFMVTVVFTLIR